MISAAVAVAPAPSIAVVLPQPSRPASPAAAATGVTVASAFTLTASPTPGLNRVTFSATGNPTVTIFGMGTTFTWPDLAPFAVTFPKNASYKWRAYGYGPIASMDDPTLAEMIDIFDHNLKPLDNVRFTASAPRTFTTAP